MSDPDPPSVVVPISLAHSPKSSILLSIQLEYACTSVNTLMPMQLMKLSLSIGPQLVIPANVQMLSLFRHTRGPPLSPCFMDKDKYGGHELSSCEIIPNFWTPGFVSWIFKAHILVTSLIKISLNLDNSFKHNLAYLLKIAMCALKSTYKKLPLPDI